eukprot:g3432.t1
MVVETAHATVSVDADDSSCIVQVNDYKIDSSRILGRGTFVKVRACRSVTQSQKADGGTANDAADYAVKIYDRRISNEKEMPYWGRAGMQPEVSLSDRARYEVTVAKKLFGSGWNGNPTDDDTSGRKHIVQMLEAIDDSSCASFFHIFELAPHGILMDFNGKSWVVPAAACEPQPVTPSMPSSPASAFRFTAARALQNAKQISSGVAYLHSCRVVHKDLYPHNVLVAGGKFALEKDVFLDEATASGSSGSSSITDVDIEDAFYHPASLVDAEVDLDTNCGTSSAFGSSVVVLKICDFNCCEMLADDDPQNLIFSAEGTTSFRPPEAYSVDVKEDGICGFKRDIWSVGVMLHVMCFGKLPFENDGASQFALQLRIMSCPERHPLPDWFEDSADAIDIARSGSSTATGRAMKRRTLANELRTLLLSLLAKDPEKRELMFRSGAGAGAQGGAAGGGSLHPFVKVHDGSGNGSAAFEADAGVIAG